MGQVSNKTEQAILNQQEIVLLDTRTQVSAQFEKINNHNRQQNMRDDVFYLLTAGIIRDSVSHHARENPNC